ncbi:uncharacterized protein [Blastocystis hominis]|uniref:Uncharacterized protein n=1 Tax=Blastocystis hominis TaxID=12968 RepID=D8LUY5_BLAHO|nr:uncharacterized protein [Blastocystis hominis]CBK19624.2 unnamed protein product [Blastocystis hominis]|eukprot:XP_012893672.1 uncharacterized protein [Blastocystis hominis]
MFALRKLCTSVPKATYACIGRSISWTSAVAENTIDLTFITPKGESKTVKARIGDTVLDTAEAYGLPICGDCHGAGLPRAVKRTENWTEETFGEGPSCAFCHVVPSLELSKVLEKPTAQELEFIEKIPIGKTPRSRLACQVPVTKEMNGGVFFIPHHVPNELL